MPAFLSLAFFVASGDGLSARRIKLVGTFELDLGGVLASHDNNGRFFNLIRFLRHPKATARVLTGLVILGPAQLLKAMSGIFCERSPRKAKLLGQLLLVLGIGAVPLQNIGAEDDRDFSRMATDPSVN